MKIIKAAYSKTFPILQYYEKVYLEAEIDDNDNVRNVLYDLKRQAESFFYESNKAAEKQTGSYISEVSTGYGLHTAMQPYTIDIARKDAEDTMIFGHTIPLSDQINSCTSLKVLESYKFIVKGKPDLEEIYNNKVKELT